MWGDRVVVVLLTIVMVLLVAAVAVGAGALNQKSPHKGLSRDFSPSMAQDAPLHRLPISSLIQFVDEVPRGRSSTQS